MKKKGLIALILAGTIATIPLGLAGCSDKKTYENKTATNLVVECIQRNKRVLHKADKYTITGHDLYEGWYINTRYDFKCDLPDIEGSLNSYPDGVPNESLGLYDEICDKCFSQGWN